MLATPEITPDNSGSITLLTPLDVDWTRAALVLRAAARTKHPAAAGAGSRERLPRWSGRMRLAHLVARIGVSIADLFRDPELTRDSPIRTLDELLQRPFHNDCEAVARKRFREVDALLSGC